MDALVGYTGFVGSNLISNHDFEKLYNSKNIQDIHGVELNNLVCSAVPSAMWLANSDPEADLKNIKTLLNHLKSVQAQRMILISTIAVYHEPLEGVDESHLEKFEDSLAYGKNRRYVEEFVFNNFDNVHILRLPALFGDNLKKNFIFDLLNPEPSFLKEDVFNNIMDQADVNLKLIMQKSYSFNDEKNMYQYNRGLLSLEENKKLVNFLKEIQQTSLQFTNPDSVFQFYNLRHLWSDIEKVIKHKIPILNLATEPLRAADIAKDVFQCSIPPNNAKKYSYDMKSKYSDYWDGKSGYLYLKSQIYSELQMLVKRS